MNDTRENEHVQFGRIPTRPINAGAMAPATGSAAKVFLSLCANDGPTWLSKVGMRKIALTMGLHISTVHAAIHQLAELGLIEILPAANGRAHTYRIETEIKVPVGNRSGEAERLKPETVRVCANGQSGDRSDSGAEAFGFEGASVRVGANHSEVQNNSHHGEAEVVEFLDGRGVRNARSLACRPGVTIALVKRVAAQLNNPAPAVLHNAVADAAAVAAGKAEQQARRAELEAARSERQARSSQEADARRRQEEADHAAACDLIAELTNDQLESLRTALIEATPQYRARPGLVPLAEKLRGQNGPVGRRHFRVEIAHLATGKQPCKRG